MKTLAERMENPVFLVIDMQNAYLPGGRWECENVESAVENTCRLCREYADAPVIFTRFTEPKDPAGVWKDYNDVFADVNADVHANALVPAIETLARDLDAPVIDKHIYSAADLSEVRTALGIAETETGPVGKSKDTGAEPVGKSQNTGTEPVAVITGVTAGCCVLSTIMSLIDAGVYIVYVKDCTAGVGEGAAEAVIKVLEGLGRLHVSIVTADELLDLRRQRQ